MKVWEIWELIRDIAIIEMGSEKNLELSASSLLSLVRITEMGLEGRFIIEDRDIIMNFVYFESLDEEDENEEMVMKITALPMEVFVKNYRKVYDCETEN